MSYTPKSPIANQFKDELTGNILPFWMNQAIDRVNGGFFGAVTNDLQVHNEVPRSAVLSARILWTFSAAYRRYGTDQYCSVANWAYDYLTNVFWDRDFGGLYWQVDAMGNILSDRKHHYAQAFGIYAFSEYYRATQEQRSLELAKEIFYLLEEHAYDPINGGYSEGSSRQWRKSADTRLSDKDMQCPKSMNTMLHILEAYTNLLLVWDEPNLKTQHNQLIAVFQNRIVDLDSGHLKLFFDEQWNAITDKISLGHDIESSWLLWEAAQVQGDTTLCSQVQDIAILLATTVYQEGRDFDGSLYSESSPGGKNYEPNKAWWVQAEAVVGFYNVYQLTHQERFRYASLECWSYILTHMVDRNHGDWYKQLHRDGTPDDTIFKIGPWECPYHHARLCLEMLERLDHTPNEC